MMRLLTSALLVLSSTALAQEESNKQKSPVPKNAVSKEAVQEITFDDLQFEIAKDAKFDQKMLREKIRGLQGKPVAIRGFIAPLSVFMREDIKTFILDKKDRDHHRAVFAPLCECVRVEMVAPATTSFTTKQITVEGEIEIKEWAVIDGAPRAIDHLKATSAK